MLHSVGCEQSQAKSFADRWNKYTATVSVHAVLDHTGTVYQCLPWTMAGMHCGGLYNYSHIGVEMTEPDGTTPNKLAQIKATYETAVELFAYLCEEFNINPLTGITSHKEAGKKCQASGHGDPEKLWNSNKTGFTMDGFRKDVQTRIQQRASIPVSTLEPQEKIEKEEETLAKNQSQIEEVSTSEKSPSLKVGDIIKLKPKAKYSNGTAIPQATLVKTLYLRQFCANGNIIFSTKKAGAVTGIITPDMIVYE